MNRAAARSAADQASANPPPLLTVPEACDRLRISRWLFYRLVQQRRLSTVKIGNRRFVAVADLQAFIERLRQEDR